MTAAAPLRIRRLTLTDFRAFPGPSPALFELDGKNLLVFGENGSGKSSIFLALTGFFSLKPAQQLRQHKNVFSGRPDGECRVAVEFTDGTTAVEWSVSSHPGSLRGKKPDSRVTEAALRRSCLDYRALLDTNYRHGAGAINLFEIAVEQLLRDYPVVAAGGINSTIGELWDKVQQAKPFVHTSSALARINQACVEFNTAFRTAIPSLLPLVNSLMNELGWKDVVVSDLRTPGLTYNKARLRKDRAVEGQTLSADLSYRGHPLDKAQLFLNEARLSALGLAIYLSGRLACTPSIPGHALKLLVLDDVLIGLDHSNRLPVLDLLRRHFGDWQIVLLTYDRIWFEMARFHLGNTGHWKSLEVFEDEDEVRGIPSPTIRSPGDKAAAAALKQARAFLADHHIPAAANYTRAAFELGLKSFCERFSVPVIFKTDPREVDTEKLLAAIESWFKAHSDKRSMAGVIERVRLFRKVVLNPYSHAAPPNIVRAEVEGAISAVDEFLNVVEKGGSNGDPIQAANELMAKAPPSTEDLHAALGFVRASFFAALQAFCERKHVAISFRTEVVPAAILWTAVMANRAVLFPAPHLSLPDDIEADRRWLISEVSEADLAALTQGDLSRLLAVLVPAAGSRLVFETI